MSSKNVEARFPIPRIETPLSCFHVGANVSDQMVRMLLRPTPTRRAARALVRRDHLEISGKQMIARPQSISNKRFGQESRGDFSFHQCVVAAFPSADFDKLVIDVSKTSGVEQSFQHEREAAGLGINADRSAGERVDGCATRSAYQSEKPAMQTHKDKEI